MPRLIDYPRASFKNGQEIAYAVDYIGGSSTIESCAEKMGKKVSGAFNALISSGVKHGLVSMKKEILTTTDLFQILKLAYNKAEKTETLRKSFLHPPLYKKIYERYKGKDLPISMLDKILIREFEVEEAHASRVAGYFIEGAKSVELLENGKIVDLAKLSSSELNDIEKEKYNIGENNSNGPINRTNNINLNHNGNSFTIAINGPGMDINVIINEEDDFFILEPIFNKIKKQLREGSK